MMATALTLDLQSKGNVLANVKSEGKALFEANSAKQKSVWELGKAIESGKANL
jgi:hypothetical protein